MKKNNFTLIELLVVIAIFGLLISILLPSLNKARQVSQAAVCMSNLQQLGRFSMIFAQQHDNVLPHSCSSNSSVAPSSRYFDNKYYENAGDYTHFYSMWLDYDNPEEGLNCPQARQEITNRWTGEGNRFNDYSQNFYMGGFRNGGLPKTYRLKSSNYMYTDGKIHGVFNGDQFHLVNVIRLKQNGTGGLPWMNDDTSYPEFYGHPKQTSNFLFGDLHIETRTYRQLVSLTKDQVDIFNGKFD